MEVERGAGWAAIVVNRDSAVFLDGCLRALSGCERPPSEIVVVDNASTDDSLTELAAWPAVVVEASPRDLGYAGAVNRGLELIEAPLALALRPDVEVRRTFGGALLRVFESQPRLGLAAPVLLSADETVSSAGGVLERPLLLAFAREHGMPETSLSGPAEIDFAPGKALVLRRQAALEVAGLDPQFWPDAYADVDLALRLRARGWLVRCEPSLQAITLSIEPVLDYHRNRLRLALKHLSPVEWAGRFLPAELERVRASLLPDAPNWPETGASAIEALARGAGATGRGLLDPQPFLDAVSALQAVADLASLEVPSRHLRRDPALDAVAAQQDAFNAAVVQAFAAQSRLNRELIAELLLALLDVMSLRSSPGPGR